MRLAGFSYDLITRSEAMDRDDAKRPRPTAFHVPTLSKFSSTTLPALYPTLQRTVYALETLAHGSTSVISDRSAQSTLLQQTLIPDLPPELIDLIAKSAELKRRYHIPEMCDQALPTVDRLASDACDQVALDLALSARIYATVAMTGNPVLAEASNTPFAIDEEPPSLQFTYFRPQLFGYSKEEEDAKNRNSPGGDTDDDSNEDEVQVSMEATTKLSIRSSGARALLSEWALGTQLDDYAWTNPYDVDTSDSGNGKAAGDLEGKRMKTNGKRRMHGRDHASDAALGVKVPRLVPITRKGYYESTERQRAGIPPTSPAAHPIGKDYSASQPAPQLFMNDYSSQPQSQSQSQRPSGGMSQVVPGVFGGDVNAKAKEIVKKKKKRMSGF